MHHDARRIVRLGIGFVFAFSVRVAVAQDKPPAPPLAADRLAAIDRISSDSLKGHLSFISSDLLEGRDTPSKGLDLAAEYIAAQFRRAGLEPVGDDGYFQTANWEVSEPDPSGFKLEVANGDRKLEINWSSVSSLIKAEGLDLRGMATVKIDSDPKALAAVEAEHVAGKVVFVRMPDGPNPVAQQPQPSNRPMLRLRTLGAAMILFVRKTPQRGAMPASNRRLIDPTQPMPHPGNDLPGSPSPLIIDANLADLVDTLPPGSTPATVSIHLAPQIRIPVKIRNVVGLLRGSDPVLKDTCVMVTAHYDHIGVRGAEGTDRIFNGANDDGSGTVSVIELATSLGSLKEHPKRSILFVTFFGEEKGLLGSRYYGRNPIFPVDKTVADINLEQVGRTDDSEGPQLLKGSLTGFGYSGVSTALVQAGEAEGVKVVKHPRNSDAFFGRSDNQALADLGVPAHTLCVAFVYPDYHAAADHWDKVDYANMARIDRTVARALLTLADDPEEPKWDETNPRAAKYLKAWKERRGK